MKSKPDEGDGHTLFVRDGSWFFRSDYPTDVPAAPATAFVMIVAQPDLTQNGNVAWRCEGTFGTQIEALATFFANRPGFFAAVGGALRHMAAAALAAQQQQQTKPS